MLTHLDQQKKKKLLSHQGLSFAGIIKSNKCKVFDIDIFKELILFYKKKFNFQINYKLIPFIYSSSQNEDDKIALNYFGFLK